MRAAVIRPDCCHLLPAKADVDLLALEFFGNVSKIILDPLVNEVELVELSMLARNPLVPDDDLVLLAIFRLKFANDREEDNVGVPVEKVRDVGLQVELEGSNLLFVILIVQERVDILDFKAGVTNLMSSVVETVEEV